MEDKLLLTYSLLAHLKETSYNPTGSLIDIFVPIAKKALSEYSNERGLTEIKGKSFSEIQTKILEIFGLEIPLPVLDVILKQIKKEINNESVFCIYGDGSFIIKTYIFTDLETQIEEEKNNIEILEEDFKVFCKISKTEFDFNELQTFILAQKVDLFSDKNSSYLDLNYTIPKYINLKFNDVKIFKIIINIYLGGIISSYLTLKITKKVTNAELLLDTNFFISLIDLNTEDSYNICNQLYKICTGLGFRFTMLYSTIEQIRILLNTRINDFASKDLIGTVRCADIFNACIRRNIDKTHLERTKDSIPKLIQEFGIVIIHEAQIKEIVEKALKSQTYKELKEKRNNDISALNDAVAELYVMQKRGKYIHEFSDVNCWFLHNSFNTFYYSQNYKIHERMSISANELLVLIWLSNPSQINSQDIYRFARGGLASYVTKYRRSKMPNTDTIRAIKKRADKAQEQGEVEEKDIYRICVRMSEGHLTQEDAIDMTESSDSEFAIKLIKYSKEEEENSESLLNQIKEKDEIIDQQQIDITKLKIQIEELKTDNTKKEEDNSNIKLRLHEIELDRYITKRDSFVDNILIQQKKNYRNIVAGYFCFILTVTLLWFVNNFHVQLISHLISLIFAFVLVILYPIIPWFINHSKIFDGFKYLFNKSFRDDLRVKTEQKYEEQNPKPKK